MQDLSQNSPIHEPYKPSSSNKVGSFRIDVPETAIADFRRRIAEAQWQVSKIE